MFLEYVQFIQMPIHRIVFDIIGNGITFLLIADNTVMKSGLP